MQNKTITIEDLIKTAGQRQRVDIHTALPGRVVSFNPDQNTVQVEPMINQVLDNGEESELPVLVDVPVQFPRGGGFVLTFPMAPGDEGLIVFGERCIDGWFVSGNKSKPLDYRLHDYSDAFFIPGVSSIPNAVPDIAMDGVSMRTIDNNTYVKVTNGKIFIKGDIEHEGSTEQKGDYKRDGNSSTTGLITGAGGLSVTGTNPSGETATISGGKMRISGTLIHEQGSITSLGRRIDGNHTHPYTQGNNNTGVPNA